MLETVDAEARKRLGEKIVVMGLRIGELSSIDRDALTFAFEALTRETPWGTLKVEVEWCSRRQNCQGCGEEFVVKNYEMACPKCGETAAPVSLGRNWILLTWSWRGHARGCRKEGAPRE